MDFRSLQYFVTVAEELHFTHAAEKLTISQPPLSMQIKQLEEDLGAQLFIRGKRKLQLTEAGRAFYRRATQILSLSQDARDEIRSLGNELSGRVRLGIVDGRAPYFTGRWIAGFHEEYPLVTFSVWNGSSDDVIDRLYKGLIDLAVVAAPYDEEHLEGITVGSTPWTAIIPADHELAKKEGNSITLQDLAKVPLIVPERPSRLDAIRRWFMSEKLEPQIFCTLSSYIDAVALVEQGAGVCIFPKTTYTPNPYIVTKVIDAPVRIAKYVLVWPKAQQPHGLNEAFIDYVRDVMEEENYRSIASLNGESEPEYKDAELL